MTSFLFFARACASSFLRCLRIFAFCLAFLVVIFLNAGSEGAGGSTTLRTSPVPLALAFVTRLAAAWIGFRFGVTDFPARFLIANTKKWLLFAYATST